MKIDQFRLKYLIETLTIAILVALLIGYPSPTPQSDAVSLREDEITQIILGVFSNEQHPQCGTTLFRAPGEEQQTSNSVLNTNSLKSLSSTSQEAEPNCHPCVSNGVLNVETLCVTPDRLVELCTGADACAFPKVCKIVASEQMCSDVQSTPPDLEQNPTGFQRWALNTCMYKHERQHIEDGTCLTKCEMEASGYSTGQACLKNYYEAYCNGATSDGAHSACFAIKASVCEQKGFEAFHACRIANGNCGCQGCDTQCENVTLSCISESFLFLPTSAIDTIQPIVRDQCKKQACVYCGKNDPTCTAPTPIPTSIPSPVATTPPEPTGSGGCGSSNQPGTANRMCPPRNEELSPEYSGDAFNKAGEATESFGSTETIQ